MAPPIRRGGLPHWKDFKRSVFLAPLGGGSGWGL